MPPVPVASLAVARFATGTGGYTWGQPLADGYGDRCDTPQCLLLRSLLLASQPVLGVTHGGSLWLMDMEIDAMPPVPVASLAVARCATGTGGYTWGHPLADGYGDRCDAPQCLLLRSLLLVAQLVLWVTHGVSLRLSCLSLLVSDKKMKTAQPCLLRVGRRAKRPLWGRPGLRPVTLAAFTLGTSWPLHSALFLLFPLPSPLCTFSPLS